MHLDATVETGYDGNLYKLTLEDSLRQKEVVRALCNFLDSEFELTDEIYQGLLDGQGLRPGGFFEISLLMGSIIVRVREGLESFERTSQLGDAMMQFEFGVKEPSGKEN